MALSSGRASSRFVPSVVQDAPVPPLGREPRHARSGVDLSV